MLKGLCRSIFLTLVASSLISSPAFSAPGDVITSFTINNVTGDGRVPTTPQGITFHDGFLWVVDLGTDRIYRVYPNTVFDTDGLTVLFNPGDSDFNIPIEDTDNPPINTDGQPIPSCFSDSLGVPQFCGGGGLTFAENFFWNASPVTDEIIKIDPVDGDNLENENGLATFSTPAPQGITFDGTHFWISDWQTNTISEVLPEDGTVLRTISGPSSLPIREDNPTVLNFAQPTGLAWDGVALWVVDTNDETIFRYDPFTETILAQFAVPGGSGTLGRGIAWDGEFLWHTDQQTQQIYQLESGVIPFGIIGCIEKNGIALSAEALLSQTSNADQSQALDSGGCFQFPNFESGVGVSLSINEAGVNAKPVLTLAQQNGSVNVSVEQGSIYVEPGFTATDPEDGDITPSVVAIPDVINSPFLIDTSALNSTGIPITYDVIDSSGNAADTQTRLVFVVPVAFDISGTVSGLDFGNSITLTNNGSDSITVNDNVAFAFPTRIVEGQPYDVQISAQPPGQNCAVANGSGTALSDVTNVSVTCTNINYDIDVNVTGLDAGDTLTIANNGIPTAISTNGTTTVDTVIFNTNYDITITTPPTNKTCGFAVTSGPTSGNVTAPVSVDIECGFIQFTLGGTLTGLETGDTPDLRLEFDSVLTTLSADGAFTLVNGINSGASYNVTLSQTPTNKDCTITNNTGVASASVTNIDVTCIDNVAPDIPTVDTLTTSDTTPVISGTAAPIAGDVLSVTIEGATYDSVAVAANTWSVDTGTATPTLGTFTALADGTYDIIATLTDPFSNSASDTTVNELTIDTAAPNAPTVNSLVTNIIPPGPLTGSATLGAGDTLSVTINGATFNNVNAPSDNWTIDLNTATPSSGALGVFADNNTYDVIVTITDTANNTTTDATTNEITVDQTAPNTPATPDLAATSDTGASSTDNITSDTTPTLTGICTTGDTINLLVNNADAGLTQTCTANAYSLTVSSPLADGVFTFAATATDPAGNLSAASVTPLSVTIDTTIPAIPTVNSVITNDTTPALSGTANLAAGETLSINVNGFIFQNVTVTANNWTIDTGVDAPASGTFTALADGTYNITATVTDTSGGATNDATSGELVVDTIAPAVPTVTALTTNDVTPTISGTAAISAGETLNVTVNGASYNNVPTNSSVWSIDTGVLPPTSGTLGSFVAGVSYSVFATTVDAAGNSSTDTTNNEILIDVTPPSAPTVDTVLTNAVAPVISGTASFGAGEVLSVTINGATYDNVPSAGGTWSIDTSSATPSSGSLGAFVDGVSYDVAASVTDSANLVTNDATVNEVTIDRTAPPVPSAPDLIPQSDSGQLDSDNITNDTTPTVTGTCSTGDIVTLYVDGASTAAGSACSGGTYSLTTASALADASYAISVTSTDNANNESAQTASLSVTVDATAPAAPGEPDLSAASDTGSSNIDNITSDTTPEFTGTCVNGDTVTLYLDGSATATTAVCAAGSYTLTPTSALPNAIYAVSALSTDTAGNIGAASTALSVTIDASSVTAPDAPDLVASSDTGRLDNDNITTDTTPTFAGSCTSGDTISFFVDGIASLDTVNCVSSSYSLTLANALSDGTFAITVTATGVSAVESPQSAVTTLTVDTTAPAAPSAPALESSSDTGSSNSDGITSISVPVVSGLCNNGDEITLFVNTVANGSPIICAANAYSISPGAALPDSRHDIAISATDAAGNESALSTIIAIEVDTSAPASPGLPDLSNLSDTGVSNTDNLTQATSLNFVGSCSPTDRVNLYIDNSQVDSVLCSGVTYSLNATGLGDGVLQVNVDSTDVAGNTSGFSSPLSVTVDTTAPALTIAPNLEALSDSGSSSSDNITNQTFATFSGACANGSTIALFVNSIDANTSATCSSSVYSATLTSALAEGVQTIIAQATDAAGNTGALSPGINVTVDTTAPTSSTPDLIASSDTGSSSTDDITSDATPTFSGTCSAGDRLNLIVDSVATSVNASCGSGTYTISSTAFLSDGSHSVAIAGTDIAGNVGAPSSALNIVVDTSAPAAPGLAPDMIAASDSGTSDTDNITNVTTPTFDGSCTTGNIVTLYVDSNNTGISTSCTGAAYSLTAPSPLSDGVRSITVTEIDAAGNESPSSPALSITIDTSGSTVPNTPDLTDASDSGISATDNITNVTQPVITGICNTNDTIRLYVDGLDSTAFSTCTASAYSITVPSVLSDGNHDINVLAENGSGVQSALSPTLNLVIDTAAETLATPDLLAGSDTGTSSVDNITQDTTPSFSGICTSGHRIQLLIDAAPNSNPNPAVCNGGSYSVTANAALTEGAHTATVINTDLAGNIGTASTGLSLTVDTTNPAVPTVDTLTPTTATPTITGTALASAGDSLSVIVNGATYNNVAVTAGVWSLDLGSATPALGTTLAPFVDGDSYNVIATLSDAAGNTETDISSNEITTDFEVQVFLNVSGYSSTSALVINENTTGTNFNISANGLTAPVNIGNGVNYTFEITSQPDSQFCSFPGTLTTITGSSTVDTSINVTCNSVTQQFSASPALVLPSDNGNNNLLISETSTINVTEDRQISDLNLYVNLSHTYIGDLSVQLTSPSGTSVLVLERPGSAVSFNTLGTAAAGDYGCSEDSIDATFDDEGAAIAETTCPVTGSALRPNNLLSAFDGESSQGIWTLTIFDGFGTSDGGILNEWSMEIVIPTP